MPKAKHTKRGKLPGSKWQKKSNTLKDFHRDHEKVTIIEGDQLVDTYKKKGKK